jgi:hypothetical protein
MTAADFEGASVGEVVGNWLGDSVGACVPHTKVGAERLPSLQLYCVVPAAVCE